MRIVHRIQHGGEGERRRGDMFICGGYGFPAITAEHHRPVSAQLRAAQTLAITDGGGHKT